MENKTPTAEEFIRDEYEQYSGNLEAIICNGNHVEFMMIEFAKLHVEMALKAAAEIVDMEVEKDFLTKDVILNAYTLTDIK
jgi:hypothetical protein